MSVIGKITAYYINPNKKLFVKTFSDILTSKNSMFKKGDILHFVI